MASPARELQRAFVDRLGAASVSDLEEGTLVVIPSATFPIAELRKIAGIARYEERLLCTAAAAAPARAAAWSTSRRCPSTRPWSTTTSRFLPDPDDARRRLTC